MIHTLLTRNVYTPEGTWGIWTLPDGSQLYTIERPWLENAVGVSCIPDGVYACFPSNFNRARTQPYPCHELFAADGGPVPGRTQIKIHGMTYPRHSRGCIGPVVGLDVDPWPWRGVDRHRAMERYRSQLQGLEFMLTIRPASAELVALPGPEAREA